MIGSIDVKCLTGEADLAALRSDWLRIADRCGSLSIFQTYEWQSTWWKHYRVGSPYLLVAYSAGPQPVAILPLYRTAEPLPLVRALRVLRPIGVGGDTSPDYLGQVAMDEHAPATATAFMRYLTEHCSDWDILELTDLAAESPVKDAISSGALAEGCRLVPMETTRIQFAELPPSWVDYLNSLTGHARYSVRSIRKKILALPASRLFQWTDAERLDSAIDQLIALHTLRWRGRADHYSFSSERYNAFHRELMHEFMRRGWLRLYCVELDGKLVGVFYGYSFRGTLYHFQGGFDPQYEKLRVGQCVMAFAIESAIGEGCTCLDMLRGEYEYKKRWAPLVRETSSFRLVRATVPAYVSVALDRFVRPIRRRAGRMVGRLLPA